VGKIKKIIDCILNVGVAYCAAAVSAFVYYQLISTGTRRYIGFLFINIFPSFFAVLARVGTHIPHILTITKLINLNIFWVNPFSIIDPE
jgi:hypothetical protein